LPAPGFALPRNHCAAIGFIVLEFPAALADRR